MIQVYTLIVSLSFLILISVIDIKTFNKIDGRIPSIATDLFLLFSLLIGGSAAVYIGVLGLIMGLVFTDLELWAGIADLKIYIACAMLFSTYWNVLVFSLIMCSIVFFYKFGISKVYKNIKTVPLIPAITVSWIISYLILLRLGMV